MSVQPITPSEVEAKKSKTFPDEVISAFNELIAEDFNGVLAIVQQKKVVARIVKKGIKSKDIFKNQWLDVEPLFEKAGWEVEYDKPGFNEDYEATFTFRKPKKS